MVKHNGVGCGCGGWRVPRRRSLILLCLSSFPCKHHCQLYRWSKLFWYFWRCECIIDYFPLVTDQTCAYSHVLPEFTSVRSRRTHMAVAEGRGRVSVWFARAVQFRKQTQTLVNIGSQKLVARLLDYIVHGVLSPVFDPRGKGIHYAIDTALTLTQICFCELMDVNWILRYPKCIKPDRGILSDLWPDPDMPLCQRWWSGLISISDC